MAARLFCYVSDLVEGLIRLMNGEQAGPINLGNPYDSIRELAELVRMQINPDRSWWRGRRMTRNSGSRLLISPVSN